MKKIPQIIFIILLLQGCNNNVGPIPEATFTIHISDFQINTSEKANLKFEQNSVFDGFTHKYPSGSLTFINTDDITFQFNSEPAGIDEFSFILPIGSYSLSGKGGESSALGSKYFSFISSSQEVIIDESTTELNMTATPTCALLLVADENNLLDSAYISDKENPFFLDGIYRYSYFIPESENRAFLHKKEGAALNFSISNLHIGYIYTVIVTDDTTDQSLGIYPDFKVSSLITW